jgi:hypothetical protein
MSFAMTRSTQNLSIPATQNTAPIIEFRCLYTHDLRQKKKRWQDGMLRFHTFNKRIMVYDIPRNFIGDTHWREDEAVQDGDELRLDKGVLIQVGDCTGSTEQDLTELLEKRRPTQEKSRSDASHGSANFGTTRPAATPLAQLRPKSLNALLGTPRGAYGRAVLPNKSPFEGRNAENVRPLERERPAKRQKIDHRMATQRAAPRPALQPPRKITSQRSTSGLQSANSSQAPILPRYETHEVISIESDDDSIMSSSPAKATTPSTSRTPKAPTKPATASAKGTEPPIQFSKAQPPILPVVGLSSEQRSESPETGFRKTLRKEAGSATEDSRPINPLRLASGKARRKLMYRELLPHTSTSEPAERSSRKAAGIESEKTRTLSEYDSALQTSETTDELIRLRRKKREQRRNFEDSDSDAFEPDLRISHKSPPSQGSAAMPGRGSSLADTVPINTGSMALIQSPPQENHTSNIQEEEPTGSLFLTQETPSEIEAAAELARMDRILLTRRPSDTISANKPSEPLQTLSKPTKALQDANTIDPPPPPSPLPKQALKPPSGLPPATTAHIPPKIPPPQHLPRNPNPRRSPFRKSLSDSNGPRKAIGTLPPKQSLQRAISDTSDARSAAPTTFTKGHRGVPKEVVEVQARDTDTGPWSREAFDLFGWRVGDAKGVGIASAGRAS